MAKTKKGKSLTVVVGENSCSCNLLEEIVLKSKDLGMEAMYFIPLLPKCDTFTIFCSNGKKYVTIEIIDRKKTKCEIFKCLIRKVKKLSGMKVYTKRISQIGFFEETNVLPAFIAVTFPTKCGEAVAINLFH